MSTILTKTGLTFDYEHPLPSMVNIKDIAHALSKEQRYCNQYEDFSVAQHCIFMSWLSAKSSRHDREFSRACLFHDAAEAFMRDISSPLKKLDILIGYRDKEKQVQSAIYQAMDINEKDIDMEELHRLDMESRRYEQYYLRGTLSPSFLPDLFFVDKFNEIFQWSRKKTEIEFLTRNLILL